MKLSEIASRLNGISAAGIGVSWETPTPDVEVARAVISYLEGRRILDGRHTCVRRGLGPVSLVDRSVYDTRSFLTETLVKGGVGKELKATLQLMRDACMEFLDAIERWVEFAEAHTDWSTVSNKRDGSASNYKRLVWKAEEDFVAHVALYQETMRRLCRVLSGHYTLETKFS